MSTTSPPTLSDEEYYTLLRNPTLATVYPISLLLTSNDFMINTLFHLLPAFSEMPKSTHPVYRSIMKLAYSDPPPNPLLPDVPQHLTLERMLLLNAYDLQPLGFEIEHLFKHQICGNSRIMACLLDSHTILISARGPRPTDIRRIYVPLVFIALLRRIAKTVYPTSDLHPHSDADSFKEFSFIIRELTSIYQPRNVLNSNIRTFHHLLSLQDPENPHSGPSLPTIEADLAFTHSLQYYIDRKLLSVLPSWLHTALYFKDTFKIQFHVPFRRHFWLRHSHHPGSIAFFTMTITPSSTYHDYSASTYTEPHQVSQLVTTSTDPPPPQILTLLDSRPTDLLSRFDVPTTDTIIAQLALSTIVDAFRSHQDPVPAFNLAPPTAASRAILWIPPLPKQASACSYPPKIIIPGLIHNRHTYPHHDTLTHSTWTDTVHDTPVSIFIQDAPPTDYIKELDTNHRPNRPPRSLMKFLIRTGFVPPP